MESFPPENTEKAVKKQDEIKFSHKRRAAMATDEVSDEKKRQAAEDYLLRKIRITSDLKNSPKN